MILKNLVFMTVFLVLLNSCGQTGNSSGTSSNGSVGRCSNRSSNISSNRTSCTDDCYCEGSAPNYAQDLAIGTERSGPNGGTLSLQYANGSSGFKIWREKGGSRILNATGLVSNGWQQQLSRFGASFSATDFTAGANIDGRVCPTHVFLSHSNMTATGRCLYYDGGNAAQTLKAATGVEAEDWLDVADSTATGQGFGISYYEGNIKTCADKGMRLPTMYETTMDKPTKYLPGGDDLLSVPTWAGSSNGVPDVGSSPTWTASNYSRFVNSFWAWSGTTGIEQQLGYHESLAVRCVLP